MKAQTVQQNQLAISYIRFSTARQIQGDTVRRQTEATERYCAKHGLVLTDAFRLQDAGISAFKSANLDATSALGQLLKQVQAGKIPKGTVLIVESLDRLSRDKVRSALTLFLNIIEAGLEIVCLSDNERKFNADSVDANSMDLVASIMVMSRAHEESLVKSHRIKASWFNKKQKAAKGGHIDIQTQGWLENKGGKYLLRADKVAVIQKVFKLYLAGYGGLTICRMLNKENLPTITNDYVNKSGKWHPYQVTRLLKNKAVIGTFIHATPEIPNYFPAAVKETDFYAAQAKIKERTTYKGQRNKTPYMFSHLLKCNLCGGTLFRTIEKGYSYLQCMNGKDETCPAGYLNYPCTEHALLGVIASVDHSLMDPTNEDIKEAQKELDALQGRLLELDNKITIASKLFLDNPSEAGTKILQQLEADRKNLAGKVENKASIRYLKDHRTDWREIKQRIEGEVKASTGNEIIVIPVTMTETNGELGFIRHVEKDPVTDVIAMREALRSYIKKVTIDMPAMKAVIEFKTGNTVNMEMRKTNTRPPQFSYKTPGIDWTDIPVMR